MIILTRLNGEKFMVNDDLIEFIDITPDTVISMTSGKKIPVAESLESVKEKIIIYKQQIFNGHFMSESDMKTYSSEKDKTLKAE